MPSLFDPLVAGDLNLANRVVMAPLTRNRSPNAVPKPITATYYAQRATAGLLITEATAISHQGQGYADVPGLYGADQLEGWKRVTDAVHAAGGRIVVQVWHVGRVSHTSLQPGGGAPVAPSAITAKSKTYVIDADGKGAFMPTSAPRALGIEELPGIVADYRKAVRAAVDAGFDGVELHAANGYLIDQFLRSGSNLRTDAYGGSIENRARLLFEVLDAITDDRELSDEVVKLLRARHEIRFNQLPDSLDPDAHDVSAAGTDLTRELIATERKFIHILLRDGKITDEVRRRIERDLDLEEASLANREYRRIPL